MKSLEYRPVKLANLAYAGLDYLRDLDKNTWYICSSTKDLDEIYESLGLYNYDFMQKLYKVSPKSAIELVNQKLHQYANKELWVDDDSRMRMPIDNNYVKTVNSLVNYISNSFTTNIVDTDNCCLASRVSQGSTEMVYADYSLNPNTIRLVLMKIFKGDIVISEPLVVSDMEYLDTLIESGLKSIAPLNKPRTSISYYDLKKFLKLIGLNYKNIFTEEDFNSIYCKSTREIRNISSPYGKSSLVHYVVEAIDSNINYDKLMKLSQALNLLEEDF